MRLKGLHDIRTHSSLAREGKLVSVARDLGRTARSNTEKGDWDAWDVKNHVYPKVTGSRPANAVSSRRDMSLEKKARESLIERIQYFLQEMKQAIAEGIPVSMPEFERLKTRLAELQAGR